MGRLGWRKTERVERVMPWAVSLGLHSAMVIAGVFLVWSVSRPPAPAGPAVETSFFNPALAPDASEDEPEDARAERASPVDLPRPEVEREARETVRPDLMDPLVPRAMEEAAPAQREAGEIEREVDARMARRYPEVRFAGLGAGNAQDVVYVIDASGPMVSSLPSVKALLKQSVSQLGASQRFQVILFKDDGFVVAPDPVNVGLERQWRLIRALRSNRESVEAWVDAQQASGRGNPVPALEHAVALLQASETGAIFILSRASAGSGAWEQSREQILETLDRLNPRDRRSGRRRLTINTIQFVDLDAAGVLEAIAREHGGSRGDSFTVISREELDGLLGR
ncbi:MAG: hypothetical protein ACNA8P_08415 [Phycisphaerales bacterium]